MRHAKKLDKLPVENSVPRTGNELQYYMQNFRKYQILSKREVAKLVAQYRRGNLRARNKLVCHNMRLVASVALSPSYYNLGVPLSDRIQQGVTGLMDSLEKFDPKLSNLATFAPPHIRSEIGRGLQKESVRRPFTIPSQMISRVRLVRRAITTFYAEFERDPNDKEIYCWVKTLLGTDDETDVIKKISRKDIPLCRDLIDHGQWRSLDEPINQRETGVKTRAETTFDPSNDAAQDLEDMIEKKEQIKLLDGLVAKGLVTSQELEIIRLRADGKKLSEIGRQFNRSRERIRQIEFSVLQKIRRALGIKLKSKPDQSARKKISRPLLQKQQLLNDRSITKMFGSKRMKMPPAKSVFNKSKKIQVAK